MRDVVDRRHPIAHLSEARSRRTHGEVERSHVVELGPQQRHRDRCVRARSDGVRRCDRTVARVLVVVEEDRAVRALFLPPLRGHAPRHPALELAPDRDGRVADVDESPARCDAYVDVDSATARRLGKRHDPLLVEHCVQSVRDLDGVAEVGAGARIEIEAQLVRVVDIAATYGPRVEGDRPQLRRPRDDRELGRGHFVGGATRRERDVCGLDVRGCSLRDTLLVKRLALEAFAGGDTCSLDDAPGPALECRGTVAQRPENALAAREVVRDDLELGDALLGEVGLVRVAHLDGALTHDELDRLPELSGHGPTLPAPGFARVRWRHVRCRRTVSA